MTAGYPPEEPIAGKPHDGICGGESQQWLSYPTFVQNCTLSCLGQERSRNVAPLGWEHIALTRDYVWADSNAIGGFRPIRDR
jgi:hypothetical protein